jgi:hypothetical protein
VAGCAGTVNTKGGTAQVGTPLAVGASLGDCEGIYLRALGDGQQYIVQLMQGAPLQTSSLPELALGIIHFMPLPGCFLTRHMLLAVPFTSPFGPEHCGTYCFWEINGPLLTRPAFLKKDSRLQLRNLVADY